MGKFDRVLAFRRLDHGCVERSRIITVIGDKSRQQDLAVLGHALCLIGTGPQAIRIIDLDGGDAGHRIDSDRLADGTAANAAFKARRQDNALGDQIVHQRDNGLPATRHAVGPHCEGACRGVRRFSQGAAWIDAVKPVGVAEQRDKCHAGSATKVFRHIAVGIGSGHHSIIQLAAGKILVDVRRDGLAAKLLVELRLRPDHGLFCHVEKLHRRKADDAQQRDGDHQLYKGDPRLRLQENWHQKIPWPSRWLTNA